jgi:hypothetical protein
MSGRLARLAAATVLATGLTTFAFAVPAHAEGEVDVNLGSLDSSMDPGETDDFTVRLRNRTDQQFQIVRVVFTVRLDGLQPNQVRIFGQFGGLVDAGSSTGEIRLAERIGRFLNEEGRRGSSVNLRYGITFTGSAPGGQAQVTAQAVANNQVLGTDQDEVRIRGEAAPTTTEPPNETGGPNSEEPGPTLATIPAEPAAANPTGGGPPAILYVLGGLLVLAGGAMLWLLFRRPRPALVDGAPLPYDTGPIGGPSRLSHPVYPPPPGPMPRRATPPTATPPTATPPTATPPTAVMPTVNPTYAPQHRAVDPWADSAEDQFPR